MATRNPPESPRRRRPTARTPEAREQQLIAKSVDLVERQIDEGTVSAQVLTHYLKLATKKEQLERRKLELQNDLLIAQAESYATQARTEEMYKSALNAMRTYSGQDVEEDEYED